ncbi:Bis(5'-nucleosyl)-tetraphosphatase, symmetrical [Ophiocordyceps camponoti-floridani]|uniref:Bis(5'-nucleosyl)-tetraphosphatase, symmetrical n=1 Tax=Ophiocordyceps camponoti-floridani TaxID=2030778 RepID=A0A8H4QCY6_9HYPO|nr:Bis(5'-nucleosyl)-tetraphosphatase, symmetrical [Ophiocordyceps camponoti-floridani]
MTSPSAAQQRILVFAATFFFLSSVYLCTTRLFAMSFSSDDDNGFSLPLTRSRPPSSPAGDIAVVSPADLPMSYGEYRRPGLQGLDKVVATLPRWLVPTRANGRRLVVVGDIHGMDRELERLLNRVGLDPRRDHVIAAGDMVAKGPDSAAVVARLMSLDASAVRGNHEDRVLLSRAEAEAARGLLGAQLAEADGARRKGQADALAVAANLSVEQVAWLSRLPVVLVADPLPLYVVHAGLVPGVALEKQDPWAIMNMRSLVYPRQQLRAQQAADTTTTTTTTTTAALDRSVSVPVSGRDGEPWTDGWNRFHENEAESHRRTVIYGHDARVGFLERNYSLGLDSGCVRGGALTAVVIRAAERGGFSHATFQVACRKRTP